MSKTPKTCIVCGAEFFYTYSKQQCCSRSCGTKLQHSKNDTFGSNNPNWKGGQVTKACELCAKQFTVKFGRKDKARFCSLVCANNYQRNNPNLKPPYSKPCVGCGNIFVTQFRRNKQREGKFCSKQCHFSWRANKFKDENNPNWVGGLSRLPYPHNWSRVSRKIRDRDGHSCLNPECTTPEHKHITAHHIDFNKFNLDESNLITLCGICNSKANFNREATTKFYQQLVRQLYPKL